MKIDSKFRELEDNEVIKGTDYYYYEHWENVEHRAKPVMIESFWDSIINKTVNNVKQEVKEAIPNFKPHFFREQINPRFKCDKPYPYGY